MNAQATVYISRGEAVEGLIALNDRILQQIADDQDTAVLNDLRQKLASVLDKT